MTSSPLTLTSREAERQKAQMAFAASGEELCWGDLSDFPLSAQQLMNTRGTEDYVVESFTSGLTAEVYRIRAQGQDWTLKRARQPAKVKNIDGQTSFLNEVQRRIDIAKCQSNPATANRMQALVSTRYASYRQGIILSPWIAGEAVIDWQPHQLRDCFNTINQLLQAGLFEWDLCAANILDDGQIRFFDFGYMYPFDPLEEFNSNGRSAPMFHGIERFETRCYFAHLLQMELTQSPAAALAAFAIEKEIALEVYQSLYLSLAARGASQQVLNWLQHIMASWVNGLAGNLENLYLREAWRSHRLDLEDDLRGKTCTPLTLKRIHWLARVAQKNYAQLQQLNALFGGDASLTQTQLLAALAQDQRHVITWQINAN